MESRERGASVVKDASKYLFFHMCWLSIMLDLELYIAMVRVEQRISISALISFLSGDLTGSLPRWIGSFSAHNFITERRRENSAVSSAEVKLQEKIKCRASAW